MEFVAISERIALLKFRVTDKKSLTVIQVYAPTSSHNNDEVEEFYDSLNKACDEHRGTWTLVIGDYNAKIGPRTLSDNTNVIGPHGFGVRNERGQRLLEFAFGQNLSVSNTFFYKKPQRRWTWFSPDGYTKNEIDYCLSSSKNIIKNIETINNIKFCSDHRPLRISVSFNMKIHRKKMINKTIRTLEKTTLIENIEQFNLHLHNSFSLLSGESCEDVQAQYDNIRNAIKTASLKLKGTRQKQKKLTSTTLQLIEERHECAYQSQSYRELDRKVKRSIRKDLRQYNTQVVHTALVNNKSLRQAMRGIDIGKSTITHLRDKNGIKHGDRAKIIQLCTEYYKNLYSDNSVSCRTTEIYSCPNEVPLISDSEVHRALSSMKYNRSPGEDGITTEALKIGERALLPHLCSLFNIILKSGTFPTNFCHSNIILLHKKGDKSDITNYRPISLVSHLYKVFIKIIENRIARQLDQHQPPEQAGFRRGLSTTDHLQSLNQLIEKHIEFHLPLYLAFVDYSKAFDSLLHSAIFSSLKKQEIEPIYISLLKNIYFNSTAAIRINSTGPQFPIERGVKQGDPLSPKLFTATLEEVFRKLTQAWEGKGILVGERRLTNLRFADDIVLFSSSAAELSEMLEQLSQASLEVGLKMNMAKTKLMTNGSERKVQIADVEVEYVQEYLYLGQIVSFFARQDKEVARRTENAWKSYWSMKDLMKGSLPLSLKRRLMDMCILPTLTYGAQTWSLTSRQKFALGVCQRAMERSILGVKLSDRVRNSILRSKTQIADVGHTAAKLKWDWAGHICRMPDELWANITTLWMPNSKRQRGRPRRRWRDELDRFLRGWPEIALERGAWKREREAFALQWDDPG